MEGSGGGGLLEEAPEHPVLRLRPCFCHSVAEPADEAQGTRRGHLCFFFFQKAVIPNISTSCFANLRTRALLSKQSAELDLGAPHVSKSPPGGGEKERCLGGGPRVSESNTQNKTRGSRKRWQNAQVPVPFLREAQTSCLPLFRILQAAHFLTAQRKEPRPALVPAFGSERQRLLESKNAK